MQNLSAFKDLKRRLDGEIHTDELRRYMLSTDGSIFRICPAAVVYPKSARDVVATAEVADQYGLSIHPRGAGSGLCGSALGSGIVLDFTKFMNRLIRIDHAQGWFECESGYRFGELGAALKESDLFFPPDPSSGEYATFGGMYGTNASGAHSVKYGNVADYILDAQIVLADGSMWWFSDIEATEFENLPPCLQGLHRLYTDHSATIESAYPDIQCNVAGYNLRSLVKEGRLHPARLFAGAEGTLGIVTRLKFRLISKPVSDSLVVAYFDDIVSAAKAVQVVLPLKPSGIEVMDKSLLKLAREHDASLRSHIPEGVDNVLLIEFDGRDPEKPAQLAKAACDLISEHRLSENFHLAASTREKARFWAVRKAAVPILYKLKGRKKILALIEDAAVPVDRLVDYFEGIYAILNRSGVDFVTYGHIAKGLLHTRPILDLKDGRDVALLKILADEMYELVDSLGGTVSGEHGDGRLRSAYVRRKYPEIYPLMMRAKTLLDPNQRLNPDIKTASIPDQMARNLRFGDQYSSRDLATKRLEWTEGFIRQVETCHGCSKCTTVTTATRMCPIYKFTRDEAASPKAKANLLRALISGAVEDGAIYRKRFQAVMDHCVNCGSCYRECPSNVNIPKLTLEARAQYVKRFGPSVHGRLVAEIESAARTTRKFSALISRAMDQPFIKKSAEQIAGLSAQRNFIAFQKRSLYERMGQQQGRGRIKALYFAGCYASYIRPEIGEAAINVLNRLGLTVFLPPQHCCGLPMLSKGMTDRARHKVMQNLRQWQDLLREADHLVVTCSSCGLSLLQEWEYLLPNHLFKPIRDKVIHISTLVNQHAGGLELSNSSVIMGYHQPCHLKVQPEAQSSLMLLNRIPGAKVVDLDSHCCGMAGSWGMAAEHFLLSKAIGSDMIQKLDQSGATIGITDCPTCRIQMEQFSHLPIKHPLEIIAENLG
jgi:FAD/FMN-containing dehydrogenase/Fe-S oxidoreductase